MANPRTAPFRFIPAARALAASCGVFMSVALVARAVAQAAATEKISVETLSPDAIDERTLDNLVAWARLEGYLQHFNPSAWAWTTNMFEYLRAGFDAVAPARTPQELAASLDRLATGVAPAAMVWPAGDARPPLPDLRGGAKDEITGVVAWRHEGFTPTMNQNGPLFSRRVLYNITSHEVMRYGFAPDNAYEAELPGGVSVWVPHANFVDRLNNYLPRPAPRERVRQDWPNDWSYTSAAERLAAVAYAWGLIQHFHPMIDREALGWDAALRQGLLAALRATDRASTLDIVRRMYAQIGDAQADAWDPKTPVPGLPPITASVIDGRALVTGVDVRLGGAEVAAGDEILSIDGVKVADALNSARVRHGAGNEEARDARALEAALSGFPGAAMQLEVRKPGGATRAVTLPRSRPVFYAIDDGKDPIREIEPGIYYVDGARASDTDVLAKAREVLQAPGVIFDLRSPYTELGMTTLGWLSSKEGQASDQFIHSPSHPDYHDVFIRKRDARVMPNPATALGKFVFLIGPGTRGDAEYAALTMQDFDMGFVFGTHTAGAPGIPARGVLPGGLEVQWTGLETRSTSGAQIFGYGVPPDVRTPLTREALLRGQDPAMTQAVEALREYFDTLAQPQPLSPAAPVPAPTP